MPLENSLAFRDLEHQFAFESYGVRVKIEASDAETLGEAEQRARKALVDNLGRVEGSDTSHSFRIVEDEAGMLHLFKNGEPFGSDTNRERFFKFFDSIIASLNAVFNTFNEWAALAIRGIVCGIVSKIPCPTVKLSGSHVASASNRVNTTNPTGIGFDPLLPPIELTSTSRSATDPPCEYRTERFLGNA